MWTEKVALRKSGASFPVNDSQILRQVSNPVKILTFICKPLNRQSTVLNSLSIWSKNRCLSLLILRWPPFPSYKDTRSPGWPRCIMTINEILSLYCWFKSFSTVICCSFVFVHTNTRILAPYQKCYPSILTTTGYFVVMSMMKSNIQ